MTPTELRKKNIDELRELVTETRQELLTIRAEKRIATDTIDINKPRTLRKTVARALTIIKEKQAEGDNS